MPSGGAVVDMAAHTGLRGAAAMWIVSFHAIGVFCEWQLDWQGSSLMPLFFQLSGFALAVTYGRTTWRDSRSCCRGAGGESDTVSGQQAKDTPKAGDKLHTARVVAETRVEEGGISDGPASASGTTDASSSLQALLPLFPKRAFFQNRLARIIPVYYLCLLVCIPLWVFGFAPLPFDPQSFWFPALVSFLPIGTIFSWGVFNLNGPCWFVCTVFVMWLFFPSLLVRAQRLTDAELVRRIVYCFWGQLIVLQTLFYTMSPFLGFWPAFQTATWNPFSRLPVFMMGMYAGLLVLRHPVPLREDSSVTRDEEQQQQQQQQQPGQDTMPWVPCFMDMWPVFPPSSVVTTTTSCCQRPRTPASTAQWSRLATRQSLGLFLFTLLVGAVDTYLHMGLGSPGGVQGAPWMQSIVAMTQLNIIVALTRDGGSSLASVALRTPFAAWLGKLSMNVYMVHMPVILYFVFLVLRRAKPNPNDCVATMAGEEYEACMLDYGMYQMMPAWGVFVIVPVSLALAEGLHRWVEEPLRQRWRCRE